MNVHNRDVHTRYASVSLSVIVHDAPGACLDRVKPRRASRNRAFTTPNTVVQTSKGAASTPMGRGLGVANDLETKRDQYLRPAEVAAFLHVSPQTVRRWAAQGKLPFVLTAGGHRRFPHSEVQQLRERLQLEALQPVSDRETLTARSGVPPMQFPEGPERPSR